MNKKKKLWFKFFGKASRMGMLNWMPDSLYLKIRYYGEMHKNLDLNNPKTFNEKLQWLKLHDRRPDYTLMVDKYEAKKYVAEKIGEEYIIPTLGLWDSFEEIDFDSLPSQFVLKCTHDSGGLVICKDKKTLDIESAKEKINKSLKTNYFYSGREWPYKDVKPRIIAEQYMVDESGIELKDYKMFCFNGVPKFVLVCKDRFAEIGMTEDFFTTEWEHIPVTRPKHRNSEEEIQVPKELSEMLELSGKLAKEIPFVRTDFYSIEGKAYFGEMTFYPASGMEQFDPDKYDNIFGEWIKLPENSENYRGGDC